MNTRRLGEHLMNRGKLSEADLERALKRRRASQSRLGELLVSEGLVTEADVTECLAEQYDLPVWEQSLVVDEFLLSRLDPGTVLSRSVLPIRVPGDAPTIAISDALDYDLTDEVGRIIGRAPRIVIAPASRIREALIGHLYGDLAKTLSKAPGDTKGRFRIDGLIEPVPCGGRFAAFDTVLKRPVTLVTFNSDDPDLIDTFAQASRIDHMRMPDLLDLRLGAKGGFAVFREFTGHSLQTLGRLRKAWTEHETVELAASLVATLRTMEHQGLTCGYVSASSVLMHGDQWSLLPLVQPEGRTDDAAAVVTLMRFMLFGDREPDDNAVNGSRQLASLFEDCLPESGAYPRPNLESLGNRLAEMRLTGAYQTAAQIEPGGTDVLELRTLTEREDTSFFGFVARLFKRAA